MQLSISYGRFPDACKIAILKWLFKKSFQRGSQELPSNLPPTIYVKSDVKIKQYSRVTYLSYELDESLSGEAMALKVMNKINGMLKFLYRKNRYLTLYLKQLLRNALIQPHFNYACSACIQIWTRNSKVNYKLSKTEVLDTVSSYIKEVTLEWKTLNLKI